MASRRGPITQRTIGFIGLGVMGRPMATHLHAAMGDGASLHLHNYDPAAAHALVSAGAIWHDTPYSLTQAGCDTIIVMVPAMNHINDVLSGPSGILAANPSDVVLAISSTVSGSDVIALGHQLAQHSDGRIRVIDAPVSGGQEGAEAATLSIMVGGGDADVARVLPLYQTMGEAVHLGPLGAGQTAKACNQIIVAATVTALAEASLLAERAGLDVLTMFNLLGQGYAGSTVLESKKERFAHHDDSPSGPAKFMIKDLTAAQDVAAAVGADIPLTTLLLSLFTDLTEQGLGDRDTATMLRYLESRSVAREPLATDTTMA